MLIALIKQRNMRNPRSHPEPRSQDSIIVFTKLLSWHVTFYNATRKKCNHSESGVLGYFHISGGNQFSRDWQIVKSGTLKYCRNQIETVICGNCKKITYCRDHIHSASAYSCVLSSHFCSSKITNITCCIFQQNTVIEFCCDS